MKLFPRLRPRALWLLALFVSISTAAAWEVPKTTPPPGLREHTPTTHALVGARIVVAPGKVIEKGNLVVRDGLITAVGPEAPIPGHARVWPMQGKTLYAGFIDSCVSMPAADAARALTGPRYWSDQVLAELRAEQLPPPDAKTNEKLRTQGVTARLLVPAAGIVHGTSALVSTAATSAGATVLAERVALHTSLTTTRKFHDEHYPNSPMGAMTLVRQALYDARWYRLAMEAAQSKPGVPRPERDQTLEALGPFVGEAANAEAKRPVVVEAQDNLYLLRADQVAREFGLMIVVRGSGEEYQMLEAVKRAGWPVVVPLDFPKPPDVASPEKAAGVSLARLMHWDMAAENPARLAAAGVKIAFTTEGLKDPATLLAAVRRAVRRGLPADKALAALTVAPAELWGVGSRLGTLEQGKAAHLVVADGDLFTDKKAKVVETWIDGAHYETSPEPLADMRGTWELRVSKPDGGSETLVLKLTGQPRELSGTLNRGEKQAKLKHVSLDGADWSATFEGESLGWAGVLQLAASLTPDTPNAPTPDDPAPAAGSISLAGRLITAKGERWPLAAKRTKPFDPQEEEREAAAKKAAEAKKAEAAKKEAADKKPTEEKGDKPKDDKGGLKKENPLTPDPSPASGEGSKQDKDEKKDEADLEPKKAAFAVNYPFGDFGRAELPEQLKSVVFRHATVWTCGPAGVLKDASVHVVEGKIHAVGKDLEVPPGTVEIDAKGKHITPGIIDCHSHIATDGGVNEAGQTITAEVRIGDFIDHQDVNLYRQLAGGVTCANILHGSANTIGGQCQTIKFRWGREPEGLKFAAAPPSIKFALGENVKQSNWGSSHSRYPQSRMGVEQLVRDEFQAALEYRRAWTAWRRNRSGLPPRTDLELEAVEEVLSGQRLVHCHAYRADEMLRLMKVCEDFGVRIATFQHVLEGYKIANEIAKHGAGASSFSDWWTYKFEVIDAIPFNGALLHRAGVLVSFNSDDAELARRLNLEAAKAVKYGGLPEAEALKFVTLNPAKQMRVDKYVGSLEPGKDADLVVWNGPPLSVYSRAERTWIDGREYFNLESDRRARAELAERRQTLVQRVLASGQTPGGDDDKKPDWPREDIFCHHGDEAHAELGGDR